MDTTIFFSARRTFFVFVCCITGGLATAEETDVWKPADGPLPTRWTDSVTPDNAWTEYPRPQMTRRRWKNLNGLWQYAITKREAAEPATMEGDILVPYPVESALSGVMHSTRC